MFTKTISLILGIVALLAIIYFRRLNSDKIKQQKALDDWGDSIDVEQEPVKAHLGLHYDPSEEPLDPSSVVPENENLSYLDTSLLDEYLDPEISPRRRAEIAEELRSMGYKVSGTAEGQKPETIPGGFDEEYDRPEELR